MNLKLYAQFVKLKYAKRMTYRFDFFMTAFAMMIAQFVGPLTVGVIFFAGGAFQDWTLGQIILMQGVWSTIRGFASMTVLGLIWNTIERVDKGTLDLLLLRPVKPLKMLIMDSFDEEDVGMFVGGLVLIGFALTMIEMPQGSLLLFVLLWLLGYLLYFSFALIGSMLAIKFVKVWRYYEFMDLAGSFASYPKTIYPKKAGTILSTLLPILVASHYPTSALLGFPLEGVILASACVTVWVLVTLSLWHKMLKKYNGAGG